MHRTLVWISVLRVDTASAEVSIDPNIVGEYL